VNGISLHQLTQFKGKYVILVTRLGLHYNPYLSAEKWNKNSSPEKSSLQPYINNALFIPLHVICVIQIMSAKQLDTFIKIMNTL